ncbi:MAG TPA: T6SS immunity protein Tli4 family protein [Azonexus sp.]
MKPNWITRAIGRHLVDFPASAKLKETYIYNEDKLEPISVRNRGHFDSIVSMREIELKQARHDNAGPMFLERANHRNGSATLISWKSPYSEELIIFDTYFFTGSKALKYSSPVDPEIRHEALSRRVRLNEEWREIESGEIPDGIGFVAGDVMLAAKRFNLESWTLSAKFPGKPDVNFIMHGFAQRVVEPGLRERAGGATGFLATVLAGKSTLRNRARPVGPITGDEILLAATQNGRRSYGFKWEAQGKTNALAEPNLIVELTDGIHDPDAAGPTSFKDDDEALALWDEIIDSIRLRPGAAG